MSLKPCLHGLVTEKPRNPIEKMEKTYWHKERTRTARRFPKSQRRFTFPAPMPFRERRRYVELWREINFNERHKVNLDYNERLKDSAHAMIAAHICP